MRSSLLLLIVLLTPGLCRAEGMVGSDPADSSSSGSTGGSGQTDHQSPQAEEPQQPQKPQGETARPSVPEAAHRAQRAIDRGDFDRAQDLARSIQDRSPAVSGKISALAYSGMGDPDAALQAVRKGLAAAPDDEDLLALEKLLRKKVHGPAEESVEAEARKLGGEKQDEAPAPDAQPDPGPAPRMPVVRPLRTVQSGPVIARDALQFQLGDPARAELDLTRVLEKEPANWLAYRLRAMARRKLKDLEGAEADADRALAVNPKDGWSYKTRALVRLDAGRPDQALADLARALAVNPSDADAYRARALVHERQGAMDRMLDDLRRAAQLDPAFGELYRQALAQYGPKPDKRTALLRRLAFYTPAAGAALLFFTLPLLPRRKGETTTAAVRTAAAAPLMTAAGARSLVSFDLGTLLGRGGMGEVYEGFDRALQRKVAIKKMRQEIAGVPRERQRFLREARLVAQLRHPCIVEIYSVFERPDGLYLVFEHVPGGTLHSLLLSRLKLPLGDALRLTRQVASALDYAHARGIAHQDLKPSNIMIAGRNAKVMDFGIARHLRETLGTMSRAEVAGTPAYMAPEQEQGFVSAQADHYALAICFYEMVSGCMPFLGHASGLAKLQKDYLPLSRVVLDVPSGIDGALDKALDPDPARRFKTAGDLAAALVGASGLGLATPTGC